MIHKLKLVENELINVSNAINEYRSQFIKDQFKIDKLELQQILNTIDFYNKWALQHLKDIE